MITVILTCYKRFENFESVIKGWLFQPEVDEIIILDNSGVFKTQLPVIVVSVNKNLGPQAKYALALWAKNEDIILADDDILVEEGIVKDFLKHGSPNRILGILGRNFTGEGYYDSTAYWGADIDTPQKVDWLGGGCTMAKRKDCKVYMAECPAMCLDDLWWESHFESLPFLYVIPTKKYKFLQENWDSNALHHHPDIKPLREKYVKELGFR